jgi:hypothetical protein
MRFEHHGKTKPLHPRVVCFNLEPFNELVPMLSRYIVACLDETNTGC